MNDEKDILNYTPYLKIEELLVEDGKYPMLLKHGWVERDTCESKARFELELAGDGFTKLTLSNTDIKCVTGLLKIHYHFECASGGHKSGFVSFKLPFKIPGI